MTSSEIFKDPVNAHVIDARGPSHAMRAPLSDVRDARCALWREMHVQDGHVGEKWQC